MKERNKEITRRVLSGETMTALGKEFGISAPRIRQIIAATCWNRNNAWYKAMPGFTAGYANKTCGFDLEWLREHKLVFINTPNVICTPEKT